MSESPEPQGSTPPPQSTPPRRSFLSRIGGFFAWLLTLLLSVVLALAVAAAIAYFVFGYNLTTPTQIRNDVTTLNTQNSELQTQVVVAQTQAADEVALASSNREEVGAQQQAQASTIEGLSEQVSQNNDLVATIQNLSSDDRTAVTLLVTAQASSDAELEAIADELQESQARSELIARFLRRLSDISGDTAGDIDPSQANTPTVTATPSPSPSPTTTVTTEPSATAVTGTTETTATVQVTLPILEGEGGTAQATPDVQSIIQTVDAASTPQTSTTSSPQSIAQTIDAASTPQAAGTPDVQSIAQTVDAVPTTTPQPSPTEPTVTPALVIPTPEVEAPTATTVPTPSATPEPSVTPALVIPTPEVEAPTATTVPTPSATPEPSVTPALVIPTPEVETPTPNAETGSPGEQQTYTVQPGDTLASIAAQFNVSLQDLLAANNIAIEDADLIRPGQTLVIP